MLENKIHEMYGLNNNDVKSNFVLRRKAELFQYVYDFSIKERVMATLSGIVGAWSGISAIAATQQDDTSMCGACVLGALVFGGTAIYNGVSSYNNRKLLHHIGKEMEEIRNDPKYAV